MLKEYNFYNSDKWEKAYFDKNSGGYLVIDKQRLAHSALSKNEKEKFRKELNMAMVLANNGYKIELLKEIPRVPSPDITIDGVLAELKKLLSHSNIVREAKEAIYKKGAKMVIFEFETMSGKIHNELNRLKDMGIKVKYFISKDKVVIDL